MTLTITYLAKMALRSQEWHLDYTAVTPELSTHQEHDTKCRKKEIKVGHIQGFRNMGAVGTWYPDNLIFGRQSEAKQRT